MGSSVVQPGWMPQSASALETTGQTSEPAVSGTPAPITPQHSLIGHMHALPTSNRPLRSRNFWLEMVLMGEV